MGIKWEDVKIGTSALTNQIYLGKIKLDKKYPKQFIWTDKSGDKTNEVLVAVFEHMVQRMKAEGYTSYQLDGYELSIRMIEENKEVAND